MWRTHPVRFSLQRPGDGERPLSYAWRSEHRPTDGRGAAAHRVQARTIHGAYSAEAGALRRMLRNLDEEQRRLLGLVK